MVATYVYLSSLVAVYVEDELYSDICVPSLQRSKLQGIVNNTSVHLHNENTSQLVMDHAKIL